MMGLITAERMVGRLRELSEVVGTVAANAWSEAPVMADSDHTAAESGPPNLPELMDWLLYLFSADLRC